jgi:predicted XRE-type DNA-binding protein
MPEPDGVLMVHGDAGEEAHLRLRAELMDAIREVIRERGLRQREAAELFGVAQPRVSDLVRGKTALFSIDTLVSMLSAAGVRVEVRLGARSARRMSNRGIGRHSR